MKFLVQPSFEFHPFSLEGKEVKSPFSVNLVTINATLVCDSKNVVYGYEMIIVSSAIFVGIM